MIEFIKNKLFMICVSLLVLSVSGNVALLLGKGITVNNKTENNLHQHQEQFSGQLQFNMWMAQGDKITWKEEKFKTYEEMLLRLQEIPPQYSYFVKIISKNDSLSLWIPEFMNEKK